MTIELRDVTMENYFDVLNLDVKEYQKQFIATNAISLAEAYVYTKNGDFVAPLAVYDNDAIIGFVMIAYDKKTGLSNKLWLSYEPENEQARFCYLSYGFKETGEISENEVVAIYDLTIEK